MFKIKILSFLLIISIVMIFFQFEESVYVFGKIEGDYGYIIKDGNATLTYYHGRGGNITIPEILGDHTVTEIGNYAFKNKTKILNINMPNSIVRIGIEAFQGCSELNSIVLSQSIIDIGDYAFAECSKLIKIEIPDNVKRIGAAAFRTSTNLKDIKIGNGVTIIEEGVFSWCKNLESIIIPESVTEIRGICFAFCKKLKEIHANVNNKHFKSIDGVLFNKTGTTLLRFPEGREGEYTVPEGVTNIAEWAFSETHGLLNVLIPGSVKSIESYAFFGCLKLVSAYFYGNAPSRFGDVVFADIGPGFTIYYKDESEGFTTPRWNDYRTNIFKVELPITPEIILTPDPSPTPAISPTNNPTPSSTPNILVTPMEIVSNTEDTDYNSTDNKQTLESASSNSKHFESFESIENKEIVHIKLPIDNKWPPSRILRWGISIIVIALFTLGVAIKFRHMKKQSENHES